MCVCVTGGRGGVCGGGCWGRGVVGMQQYFSRNEPNTINNKPISQTRGWGGWGWRRYPSLSHVSLTVGGQSRWTVSISTKGSRTGRSPTCVHASDSGTKGSPFTAIVH